MTSKPDSVSKLGYHWTDRTGRPLEPHVHWDATGTTVADASTQWCSSGDPVLICIIGTHWKTTGATSTLECHWNHTGWCLHPVVSQWRSSVNLHNWNTGRPLEALGFKFQAHWIATGRPLAQGKGCYVHWYVWDECKFVQKRKWIGCLKHKHEAHYAICIIIRTVDDLLPEASFGLRVLSSPASVGLCVRVCVCVCVAITSLSGR